MNNGHLTINLGAIARNWQALDRRSSVETGAVVKANAYGLGAAHVALCLAGAGARSFYVALASEGIEIRKTLGPEPAIFVFAGHMDGDAADIRDFDLIPLLNSVDQCLRHLESLPGQRFGLQLDSGMNRLGIEPAEWAALRDILLPQDPVLIMSHLACADDPGHAMNPAQLETFREMTADLSVPRSLAATGGILLGEDYHFDMTRPGIGLYGGLPFHNAEPVVTLSLPVIQTRVVTPGEPVGYGNSWTAQRATRVATVSAGYADGLLRALGNGSASHPATLWAGETPCPILGRVSMDLITADVSGLSETPASLTALGARQGIDDLAAPAGTIGYEILTSLGPRYTRTYRP